MFSHIVTFMAMYTVIPYFNFEFHMKAVKFTFCLTFTTANTIEALYNDAPEQILETHIILALCTVGYFKLNSILNRLQSN